MENIAEKKEAHDAPVKWGENTPFKPSSFDGLASAEKGTAGDKQARPEDRHAVIEELKARLHNLEELKNKAEMIVSQSRIITNNLDRGSDEKEKSYQKISGELSVLNGKISALKDKIEKHSLEAGGNIQTIKPLSPNMGPNSLNIINVMHSAPEKSPAPEKATAVEKTIIITPVSKKAKKAGSSRKNKRSTKPTGLDNPKKPRKLKALKEKGAGRSLSLSVRKLDSTLQDLLKIFGENDNYAGYPDAEIPEKLSLIIEQNNRIIKQNDKLMAFFLRDSMIEEKPLSSESLNLLARSIFDNKKFAIEKLPLTDEKKTSTNEGDGSRKRISHQEIRELFGIDVDEQLKQFERSQSDKDDFEIDGLGIKRKVPPKAKIFPEELSDSGTQPIKTNTAPKPPYR